jgi:hypothetical protein
VGVISASTDSVSRAGCLQHVKNFAFGSAFIPSQRFITRSHPRKPSPGGTNESTQVQRKVRYAVLGLGHLAQVAVLPAFKNAPNSEVVAIVSGDAAPNHG